MALYFDSNSEEVNHGSGSSIDNLNTGTFLIWMYPDNTLATEIMCKGEFPGGFHNWYFDGAQILAFDVGRATTSLLVKNANTIAFSKWWCWAGVWDTAGANGDQKMYTGDLSTAMAEIASYTTQRVGSGTVGDDSGSSLHVGNYNTPGAWGDCVFRGRIAIVMFWNRVLTLGELQAQQFRPHVTSGCVLFVHCGWNGTGTQPDWSGNGNSGTVTGATVADHVPLAPPFGHAVWTLPTAGAAAGVPKHMMYYARLRR